MLCVDLFCIGVKDVLIFAGPETTWKNQLAGRREAGMVLEPIAPE